ARVEPGRRQRRARLAGAVAQLRLAALLGARQRDAHVVDHRILHRDLQAPPLAGLRPLVERAENADRHQHAGAGVAERGAGFDRWPIAIAGYADRPAGGLRDHVEGEAVLVWAPGAAAPDLASDE